MPTITFENHPLLDSPTESKAEGHVRLVRAFQSSGADFFLSRNVVGRTLYAGAVPAAWGLQAAGTAASTTQVRAKLPLHASARVALCQRLDFLQGHPVIIPGDGMLQATGGHGEFYGLLRLVAPQQRIDQPPAETVSAAHPV